MTVAIWANATTPKGAGTLAAPAASPVASEAPPTVAVAPRAKDEVTLSKEAKEYLAQQKGKPDFRPLDYNTLEAVWHDPEDLFTQEEQEAALFESNRQQYEFFSRVFAMAEATGDQGGAIRAGLAFFDSLSPEGQARQGGAQQRAALASLADHYAAKDGLPEEAKDAEPWNLFSDMLLRMREAAERDEEVQHANAQAAESLE